jgi:anti-sigma regulatory factor (Ser/Thr protein kinase)
VTSDPLAVLHNRAARGELGGPRWLKLRAEPRVVQSARLYVASMLPPDADPEHAEDVALATSELVTNALNATLAFADRMGITWGYQATPVHVRVLATDRLVHLYARDPDPMMPPPRKHDLMDDSGRGLDILAGQPKTARADANPRIPVARTTGTTACAVEGQRRRGLA